MVLVLGFSNIFADALSMGVGEYLSSKVRPCVHTSLATQHQYPMKARATVGISWSFPALFGPRAHAHVLCIWMSGQKMDDSHLPHLFQAHNEYVMAEKRREEWELKNHREGEILEMVEIFEVGGCLKLAD